MRCFTFPIATIALTFMLDSTSQHVGASLFNNPFSSSNDLNQPGLKITPYERDVVDKSYNLVTYNGVDAIIRCTDNSQMQRGSFYAYNASSAIFNCQIQKIFKEGKDFVSIPLHRFEHKGRKCFVIGLNCDTNIGQYFKDQPVKVIIPQLLKFVRQIISGLMFMHRSRVTNNSIGPKTVCINKSITGSPSVLLYHFGLARPLVYNGNRLVPEDMEGSPFLFESVEEEKNIKNDRRKFDTWSVGVLMCQLLVQDEFTWDFSNQDILPNETVEMELKQQTTGQLHSSMLASVLFTLHRLMAKDANLRDTPEQFLYTTKAMQGSFVE
ncbi:hypothetical protein BDF19DRAFT_443501 [Syncephalis fuscata]|nr:hypothetical protein BDF19DRAFT_443501 [Syncephalis fuscata]